MRLGWQQRTTSARTMVRGFPCGVGEHGDVAAERGLVALLPGDNLLRLAVDAARARACSSCKRASSAATASWPALAAASPALLIIELHRRVADLLELVAEVRKLRGQRLHLLRGAAAGWPPAPRRTAPASPSPGGSLQRRRLHLLQEAEEVAVFDASPGPWRPRGDRAGESSPRRSNGNPPAGGRTRDWPS